MTLCCMFDRVLILVVHGAVKLEKLVTKPTTLHHS